MRYTKSKVGDVVGKFKYLECLSADESTVRGNNPKYKAICTDCGSIRELYYRNRSPVCFVCKKDTDFKLEQRGQDEGAVTLIAWQERTKRGRAVRASNKFNAYAKLTRAEQKQTTLLFIDEDGLVHEVVSSELDGLYQFAASDPMDQRAAIMQMRPEEVEEQRKLMEEFAVPSTEPVSTDGTGIKDAEVQLGRSLRQDDFPPGF